MKISKSLTCFVLTWAKRLFIVFNIIVMDSNEKEQSAGKAEKQGRSFNFLHLVQLISNTDLATLWLCFIDPFQKLSDWSSLTVIQKKRPSWSAWRPLSVARLWQNTTQNLLPLALFWRIRTLTSMPLQHTAIKRVSFYQIHCFCKTL